MVKLLVELFREYERRKHSSSVGLLRLVNSTDDDDEKKEKMEDVEAQGDSQRTKALTLQVSRYASASSVI